MFEVSAVHRAVPWSPLVETLNTDSTSIFDRCELSLWEGTLKRVTKIHRWSVRVLDSRESIICGSPHMMQGNGPRECLEFLGLWVVSVHPGGFPSKKESESPIPKKT